MGDTDTTPDATPLELLAAAELSMRLAREALASVDTGRRLDDPEDPPPTPDLDQWYAARHQGVGSDTPSVTLWWPRQAPQAILETTSHGCNQPDTLARPEAPVVHVKLGSIDIGGNLDDMEAYFAAAVDALRFARWQANVITTRMAAEANQNVASDG